MYGPSRTPSVPALDPSISQAFAQSVFGASRQQSEVPIFFQRPPGGEDPLWIVISDSQPLKMVTLIIRGFNPLMQFERVRSSGPAAWGQFLSHPEGPPLVPVDQILDLRWWDAKEWRRMGLTRPPYFPQLAGQPIKYFDCPECNRRTFRKAVTLARHLHVSHEYDRTDIIALGKAMGIDFTKDFAPGSVTEFIYDVQPPSDSDDPEDYSTEYRLAVSHVSVPTKAQLDKGEVDVATLREAVALDKAPPDTDAYAHLIRETIERRVEALFAANGLSFRGIDLVNPDPNDLERLASEIRKRQEEGALVGLTPEQTAEVDATAKPAPAARGRRAEPKTEAPAEDALRQQLLAKDGESSSDE